VYAAVDLGCKVLCDAYEGLDYEQDVGDETQDGMGRFEMCAVVIDFVDLNGDEAGDQGQHCDIVESCVSQGSLLLLLRCMGGLEDESALGYKYKASLAEVVSMGLVDSVHPGSLQSSIAIQI
jgi:hypothetical protein